MAFEEAYAAMERDDDWNIVTEKDIKKQHDDVRHL
jgi:hypothetical protein